MSPNITPSPSFTIETLLLLIFVGNIVVLDVYIIFEYLNRRKISQSWWLIGLGLSAISIYFGVLQGLGSFEDTGPSKLLLATGISVVLLLPSLRLFFLMKQKASDKTFVYQNVLWLAAVPSSLILLGLWLVIAMGGPYGDQ